MENLIEIIFISGVVFSFIYLAYTTHRKRKSKIPEYIPTENSNNYGKFEVILDLNSSFNVCFTNIGKTVIYGTNSDFCKNDQFNSPAGEFSTYDAGTMLYVGCDGSYIKVITDGSNYCKKISECVNCE